MSKVLGDAMDVQQNRTPTIYIYSDTGVCYKI